MSETYEKKFVQPVLDDALLGACRHEALARLLPHLVEQRFAAGTTLYDAGDATGSAWLILAGSVRLEFADGQHQLIEHGLVGEEAGTDLAGRQVTAVTATPLVLLEIPLASLKTLIRAEPELRTRCYQLLLSRSRHETQLAERGNDEAGRDDGSWREVVGWALTVIGPALILWFGTDWDLRQNAVLFLAMFCATVVMWVFTLVDEYVPSLFALLAILVLGLAPPTTVLSGFASDTFFLAMSVLGLGTVIVASGLSYRLLLWVLMKLPNHPFWQNIALLATGMLLTPVVPSINGRVALVAPLMDDMAETLRLPPRHRDTTRLAITAFTGASLWSAVFLTSKSVNFVIFGLLPAQVQSQFTWLHWTVAAAVAGAVTLLGHFVASSFLGTREDRHLSRSQLAAQLHLLGRVKSREWAALFGIGIFTLGVATAAIHKVQPPWVALTILYALLLFGFLRKREFNERIDWPFLVYLGGLAAITAGFNAVGLNTWLASHLSLLGGLLQGDLELFMLVLFGVIFLIRLVVPISATIVIAAAVFMPLADTYGVNSWVVGMAVLILGEMWFFPYQCSYYMQFRSLVLKHPGYDEKTFLLYNALMNLIKLAALYASLPYWKWLGLL